MPDIFLVKTLGGKLVGANETDRDLLKKWDVGEVLRCKVTKPRNVRFHRKFFALLNVAYENQDTYTNPDIFRKAVTIAAGEVTEVPTVNGSGVHYLPKSISFASMDELEFGQLYNKVRDLIISDIIPGVDGEELDSAVLQEISQF